MTKKEMTEIFSVMLLAWPSAEMFKGGIQKLGPTIQLWTTCLEDVDYWTAQQAVVRLCKECKFPPAIADFREKVDKVNSDIKARIGDEIQAIRLGEHVHGSTSAYYEKLPTNCTARAVIDAMGGPENLIKVSTWNGQETSTWNWDGFEKTYRMLLRKEWALGKNPQRALGAGTKE